MYVDTELEWIGFMSFQFPNGPVHLRVLGHCTRCKEMRRKGDTAEG